VQPWARLGVDEQLDTRLMSDVEKKTPPNRKGQKELHDLMQVVQIPLYGATMLGQSRTAALPDHRKKIAGRPLHIHLIMLGSMTRQEERKKRYRYLEGVAKKLQRHQSSVALRARALMRTMRSTNQSVGKMTTKTTIQDIDLKTSRRESVSYVPIRSL
jgi:hypothetical protein